MDKSFEWEYDVNFSDIDYNGSCKLVSLLDFLGDIGVRHAEYVGDTKAELIRKGYVWVFYNYDVNILKYPEYCEKIKISTSIDGFSDFYAKRRYIVTNEKGEIIAESNAVLLLVDYRVRKAIKIPEEEFKLFGVDKEVLKGFKVKVNKIKNIKNVHTSKKVNVEISDIDLNYHVNNVKYIEWAINSTDVDIVKNYVVKEVKVLYKKEVVLGEEITCLVEIEKEEENRITCLYNIKNSEGYCVNKIEIDWVRK